MCEGRRNPLKLGELALGVQDFLEAAFAWQRADEAWLIGSLGMMSSEVTGALHDVGTAEIFGSNATGTQGLGCNIMTLARRRT